MAFLAEVVRWFADGTHWSGTEGVIHRTYEHVVMSMVVMLAAMGIALPAGLFMGHTGKGAVVAINVSNIGRAVPSFAILVLAAQVFGIGAQPVFIALVALAIPPIVTNTYTGIREVGPEVREAGKGVGFTGLQLLRRVELPMGLPLIMAGIRTSGVQVVATATLGALVGWGGLGRFIVDGLAVQNHVRLFAGAVLVAALALLTEVALGYVQRVVVPTALVEAARRDRDARAGRAALAPKLS